MRRLALLIIALAIFWLSAEPMWCQQADYEYVDAGSVQEFNSNRVGFSAGNDSDRIRTLLFQRDRLVRTSIDLSHYGLSRRTMINLKRLEGVLVAPDASPILREQAVGSLNGLIFSFSRLDFFDTRGRPLGSSCDEYVQAYFGLDAAATELANRSELWRRFRGPFSLELAYLNFDESNLNEPHRRWCPLVFKDASIKLVVFMHLATSFFKNQLVQFEEQLSPPDERFALNCRVEKAVFENIFRVEINWNVLNREVYRSARFVQLQGILVGFSNPDLFRPFAALKNLDLTVLNSQEFFHSTDNKWLGGLNSGRRFDPDALFFNSSYSGLLANESFVVFMALQNNYFFPDEDLCLFKFYPHEQLVLSVVRYRDSIEAVNLTCTLLHLVAYSYLDVVASVVGQINTQHLIHDDANLTALKEACRFAEKLKLCELRKFSTKNRLYVDAYSLNYYFKWIELVGPIATFPLVSALGFALNLLIVLVLRNKANRKELFKSERMFVYIELEAACNALECLVSAFLPLTECLELNSSVFCSALQWDAATYVYKLYVYGYVGESLKTCSIVVSLAFSLERYLVTLDSDHWLCRRFKSMNMKAFVPVMVLFAFSTSLCKLNQFKSINNPKKLVYNLYSTEAVLFDVNKFQGALWYQIIYALHYVLNDLVLIVVNLIVDAKLISLIRRDLQKKLKFKAKTHSAESEDYKKTLRLVQKAEKDTNKMIIYKFLVYLLCRIPELVLSVHFLLLDERLFGHVYTKLCVYVFCVTLDNIVQYIYMLSYSLNIYFIYRFNKPFRLGLKRLFCRSKR